MGKVKISKDAVLYDGQKIEFTIENLAMYVAICDALETQLNAQGLRYSKPQTVDHWAQNVFHVHRNTMSKMLRRGKVRAVQFGRQWRIAEQDIPQS